MPIAWLQKLLGNNQGMVRLVTEVYANPIRHPPQFLAQLEKLFVVFVRVYTNTRLMEIT